MYFLVKLYTNSNYNFAEVLKKKLEAEQVNKAPVVQVQTAEKSTFNDKKVYIFKT